MVFMHTVIHYPIALLILLHFLIVLPLLVPLDHLLVILDLLGTLTLVELAFESLDITVFVGRVHAGHLVVEDFNLGVKVFDEVAEGVLYPVA